MPIQIKFTASTDAKIKKQADGIPSWYPNHVGDKNYWWGDGTTTTDYFYSINGNDMFIQYGQNTSIWAGCRHMVQSVRITKQKENDDGSVYVEGEVVPILYSNHRTDYAMGGVRVITNIYVQEKIIWTKEGNTTDEFQKDSNIVIPFSTTVAPSKYYTGTALKIVTKYPNHEFSDSTIITGLSLYNPAPPTYKPMAIRKSNVFKTLNRASGFIRIRKSNNWKDISEETLPEGEPNKGKNRIRKSGAWRKQSKIGN